MGMHKHRNSERRQVAVSTSSLLVIPHQQVVERVIVGRDCLDWGFEHLIGLSKGSLYIEGCRQSCHEMLIRYRINSPTKFRAGRFGDGDILIPLPPPPHSSIYRDDARRQIGRQPQGLTPFISTTSSLLRALSISHSAIHPSSIAVIDLHIAGKVDTYDDDENPFIQHVHSLNLNPGDSYKGRGEVRNYL